MYLILFILKYKNCWTQENILKMENIVWNNHFDTVDKKTVQLVHLKYDTLLLNFLYQGYMQNNLYLKHLVTDNLWFSVLLKSSETAPKSWLLN